MRRLRSRQRVSRLEAWFDDLWLPAWLAALVGGVAGALVGAALTRSMVRHAVFTAPHQDWTAGAALTALWCCIGVIAGLTVLSPRDEETHPSE